MTTMPLNAEWPVLASYEGERLTQIALPLGGIGTGTVSLGGRGNLLDWEVMNRPAKGCNDGRAVFVLYARAETEGAASQEPVMRALEGVLAPPFSGASGATAAYHGMPRFRQCAFHTAYPLAQVMLSDPAVPLEVRLEAFNPLVPADADASGLPVAVLRYVLHNPTAHTVSATVCGTLRNFVGSQAGGGEGPVRNLNRFRAGPHMRGLYLRSEGVPQSSEAWGTMALATTAQRTSHWCDWPTATWNGALIRFWDDLSADGRLILDDDSCDAPADAPIGSLAAEVSLAPGATEAITFLLTWHFPNRCTWTPRQSESDPGSDRVGNYYTTQYADAWEAAERVAQRLPELEAETLRFVRGFCSSDLPGVVKEAALFNLSTLRTQTCFRTEDGRFYGFEGCNDSHGSCYGSCTHVWNYEQATAHLFGDLARGMREVEFGHATDDRGHMSFRVNLPLERARDFGLAAADGQMGCILKAYRDWQLSGDEALLRALWPRIKAALAFCWVPGGWDADQDGVMEGCQHNTLDVEYYGPNGLMGAWYLGALRAGEEMARHVGDDAFAARCRELFARGSAWLDAHLFNGEYYPQQVRPPAFVDGKPVIAEGLRSSMGASDVRDPDFQLGPGCLVDQLVGQLLAHVCGLGHLLAPANVRTTLQSILRYNWRDDLYGHFNPMRTYALNDEAGLLMASFPQGGRPRSPVPYYSELMTGFEYAAAVHMLYEGMVDEGLRCMAAVRARYDGRRRNPFDEAECGHHYARAMDTWGAVLALSGFRYSAVRGLMRFRAAPGRHFWSTGYAWGTCEVAAVDGGLEVALEVAHGELELRLIGLGEGEPVAVEPARRLARGDRLCVRVAA